MDYVDFSNPCRNSKKSLSYQTLQGGVAKKIQKALREKALQKNNRHCKKKQQTLQRNKNTMQEKY